jgi:arginine decarboxylase
MKNSYFDLIEQSYYFPQEGFDLRDDQLTFHGVSLKHLIDKYGTPFRFIYLPKIGDQIKKARNLFNRAIKNNGYKGKYNFCYCTKCNHFYHVINEALKHKVNIETSSSFDIDLIIALYKKKKIDLNRKIVCNGYKTDDYLKKIIRLYEMGFTDTIVVLDSTNELDKILKLKTDQVFKVGLRMAINEEASRPITPQGLVFLKARSLTSLLRTSGIMIR